MQIGGKARRRFFGDQLCVKEQVELVVWCQCHVVESERKPELRNASK